MSNLNERQTIKAIDLMTAYTDTARAYEYAIRNADTIGTIDYVNAQRDYETAQLALFSAVVSGIARQEEGN